MLKIGHRGACGHAPENTIGSMQKAFELGADGIEFDIQLSKDGEPMVIHDATLDRTTNGKGRVSQFTYAELQTLDAGQGECIPHLNDIFTHLEPGCVLMIELKADAVIAVENIIRTWVAKGWRYEHIWVLSFNHAYLAHMRALNPHIQTCASFEKAPIDCSAISDAAIGPCLAIVTPALVAEAKARSLKIFTWTVNDPRDIAKAKALGVDGIISDFPERI